MIDVELQVLPAEGLLATIELKAAAAHKSPHPRGRYSRLHDDPREVSALKMAAHASHQFRRHACMLPFGIDVEEAKPDRVGSLAAKPHGADDAARDAAHPHAIQAGEAMAGSAPPGDS